MNAVDIILVLGLALATLRGWRIGLLMSLVSLLAILVAYIAALAYGGQVAEQLAGGSVDRGSLTALIGFALVFLMGLLLCHTLGRVLHTVIRATPFGFIDGGGGALIGAAGGVLVLGLITILLRTHSPHDSIPGMIDESQLGNTAQRSALVLVEAIHSAIPATQRLHEILGVSVDPSSQPRLVDEISHQAGSAHARLDSLLKASRKRLEAQ